DLDKGDLIFIDSTLYGVRTALKDGAAQTKLVPELSQWRVVDRTGDEFRIAFAGDIEKGEAPVAICKSNDSLVACDEIEGVQAW
ncbi:hypothetical protein, partial [Escherichia coli]